MLRLRILIISRFQAMKDITLSTDNMQWPFKEWGADIVIAGHEHDYERIVVDGLTYLVNGLGGFSEIRDFNTVSVPGSVLKYNSNFGALFMNIDSLELNVVFLSVENDTIDELKILR
jgi:hypothetical protein